MALNDDLIKQIVINILSDQDYLGGPMQRIYPRAIVESLADQIAGRVMELVNQ